MGYGHKLGEHRSTEDGVVRGAEVRDLKHQVLCAEVFVCAKGDWQAYTTYGVCSFAGYNPVEGLITGGHLVEVEVHLSERFCEDDVQTASPINEGLRLERPIDYGVDDQRVRPGVWYVDPMIFLEESD
jgi:hypothetical protein